MRPLVPQPTGWPIRVWRTTRRYGVHEAVLVVVAFLIYYLIRGAVVDRAGEALDRAFSIIAFEQQVGLYWEREMQSWILDHYLAIRVMNWIYFWGHLPIVILFAVFLFVWHRHTYFLVRNAFLASGAIGVVIYALYPVAPPRLVPFAGFVDTMAVFDRIGYQAQETQAFVNPFAAVPSLHFGWSMLLGAVVAWVGRRHIIMIVAGVAWPIAMFFSIVMTGNHFVVDAIAGGIVSFAGFGVAFLLHLAWPDTRRRLKQAAGIQDEPLVRTEEV